MEPPRNATGKAALPWTAPLLSGRTERGHKRIARGGLVWLLSGRGRRRLLYLDVIPDGRRFRCGRAAGGVTGCSHPHPRSRRKWRRVAGMVAILRRRNLLGAQLY